MKRNSLKLFVSALRENIFCRQHDSPKCAEWNKLLSGYQQGVVGTAPGKKCVEAKSFYQFRN